MIMKGCVQWNSVYWYQDRTILRKGWEGGFKFMSSDTNSSHLSESFRFFFLFFYFLVSQRDSDYFDC